MNCLTCGAKLPEGQWYCGPSCVAAEVQRQKELLSGR